MAAPWDLIAIPFVAGIDSKTDAKVVSPGRFVDLKNINFTEHGSVKKRPGYRKASDKLVDGTSLPTPTSLSVCIDELLALSDTRVHSYDSINDQWADVGSLYRMASSEKDVAVNTHEQTNACRAEASGVVAYAWEDSRGGVRASIVNSETGAPYDADKLLFATAAKPRVVKAGPLIHIYFVDTGASNIRLFIVNPLDISGSLSASASSVITNLSTANGSYDAKEDPNNGDVLLTWLDTSDNIRVTRVSSGGLTSGTETLVNQIGVEELALGVNDSHLAVAYRESTTDISIVGATHSGDTITLIGAQTAETTADAGHVTLAIDSNDKAHIFWEITNANPEDYLVRKRIYDIDGDSFDTVAADFKRHTGIGSHAWDDSTDVYINLLRESALQIQNSYFTYRDDGQLINRSVNGVSQALFTDNWLPAVHTVGSSYKWAAVFRRRLDATFNNVFGHKGIRDIEFDTGARTYSAELGKSCYFTGGLVYQYDGVSPVEAGFLEFPEPEITLGGFTHSFITDNGAGNIDTGIHGYRFYWEYTLANGERVRSAGISFSYDTTSGGAGSRTLSFVIPTLTHTLKTSPRTEVALVGYRTINGGSAFFRITDVNPTFTAGDNAYYFNDPSVDTVTVVDNLSDADLVKREFDYQNSGELDNVAPSAGAFITRSRSRIFMAGGAIPGNTVVYSKIRADGFPVDFNDALEIKIDDRGGAITALATLNGALVAFKQERLFIVQGDGPTNTGLGDFQQAYEISSDVGCDNPASIVETPQGVIFQSSKGIYLLGQNLQVSYLGAIAEGKLGNNTITAATLLPDTNQIIFLLDNDETILYDYFFNAWATFTNHLGLDAVIWRDTYVYLRDTNEVFKQDATFFRDDNTWYPIKMRLGPIRPGNTVQGRWQCRRIAVLGDFASDHTLRMRVFRNRNSYFTQEKIWDPDDFLNQTTWGSGDTWGSDAVWGGDGKTREYQVCARIADQIVQTVSFEFESLPGDDAGEDFSLTELLVEYAPLDGVGRIASIRK